MKTKIFNLIILDESGSMIGIKKEAINNVNESLQTILKAQKENPDQEHYVTFVSFNNSHKTLWNCIPANEAKEISTDDYNPNCNTALYDAMGFSLNELRPKVADNDKVLVTIVTDGMENASREYNSPSIKKLVDELKSKGWVFAYIGANHDVEKVAMQISITNTMSFQANPHDTSMMTNRTNKSRERLYRTMSDKDFNSDEANSNFFE
ncbi:MAG: VWA domain-containing protein [Lentimicrobiaceae bacterium]|nr:VWA domain-containing protein [Lentimicrobiaceae bacterium]